jgi:DNA-binding HxlR family transcriptional regulator
VPALEDLFHHRWSVPTLALLAGERGARLVRLSRALGASPGACRTTLDALIGMGLVVRNPGYGHPLRPEYILTPAGEALTGPASTFERAAERLGRPEIGRRKWVMPALHAIGEGPERYTDVRARLPGVTDRALSGALAHLEAASLVTRRVVTDRPVRTLYAPSGAGRSLQEPLRELAAACA